VSSFSRLVTSMNSCFCAAVSGVAGVLSLVNSSSRACNRGIRVDQDRMNHRRFGVAAASSLRLFSPHTAERLRGQLNAHAGGP